MGFINKPLPLPLTVLYNFMRNGDWNTFRKQYLHITGSPVSLEQKYNLFQKMQQGLQEITCLSTGHGVVKVS